MILEHDIPPGGRLYYGEKARRKREIEQIAAQILEGAGFREIVTPFFSYHQREVMGEEELIRFTDRQNREVALRGDSSIDVIRLVLKRLKSSSPKWFYIQPVFRYPSREIYQIGAEWLGGRIGEVLKLNLKIFEAIGITGVEVVVGNIRLVEEVLKLTGLPLSTLRRMEISKFNSDWLRKLARVTDRKGLASLPLPPSIATEAQKLAQFSVTDCIIAPLLVPNFRYYTGIFYKIVDGKGSYAQGGIYRVNGVESVGFSIYTDRILEREF